MHKFTDSKGRTVNFEARRPIAHPETLAELKQHPELYELYLEKNRIYLNAMYHKRAKDPLAKSKMLASQMRWRKSESGKKAINKYIRHYRSENPQTRIAELVRSRIYRGVVLGKCIAKAEQHLGCAVPYYRSYLEKQFEEGMSWSNFGRGVGKWCIDHVRPIAFYDLTDPEQLKACFLFSNTRAIWFRVNAEKWHIDKHAGPALSPSSPSSSASVP